jgi:hypothetical protein
LCVEVEEFLHLAFVFAVAALDGVDGVSHVVVLSGGVGGGVLWRQFIGDVVRECQCGGVR